MYIFKNQAVDSDKAGKFWEYLVISDAGKVQERFACSPEQAGALVAKHGLTPVSFADCRRMGAL